MLSISLYCGGTEVKTAMSAEEKEKYDQYVAEKEAYIKAGKPIPK